MIGKVCKIVQVALVVLGLAIVAATTTGTVSDREGIDRQGPLITFRFDDGLMGQYEHARPILDEYGFPAILYIFTDPPEESNWEGYMDWDQIEELAELGWEIGSHGQSHSDLTQLSNSQLIEELAGSKEILESHGFRVRSFTSPFGRYNHRTLAAIARFYETHNFSWPDGFNSFPFSDYEISVQEVRNSVPVAEVKEWIDGASSDNKWLVLSFHEIVEADPRDYEYTRDDFAAIVDYVSSREIPVVTVSEAFELPGPNLVPNHSFESTNQEGWARHWVRSDLPNAGFVIEEPRSEIDSHYNGASPSPRNSLKIIESSNSSRVYLRDSIEVDPSQTYLLKAYFNCQAFEYGGVDLVIDEYNAWEEWLSWNWQTGIWSAYVGTRAAVYTPGQEVRQIRIWVQSGLLNDLTCYIDKIIFTPIDPWLDP